MSILMIRLCRWFQWLKKQADARKVIETADADLSEEERNPMFLKDKAESVVSLIHAYRFMQCTPSLLHI